MNEQETFFPEYSFDGKAQRAIDTARLAGQMSMEYYREPMVVCYSGGKDSDVLLDIVKRAGVPFEVLHSLTTVDAPQTVYHIRNVFADLQEQGIKATIRRPEYKGERATMWRLIEINSLPPTRIARYCCKVLKETATPNRLAVLGVRKDESAKRKERSAFEVRARQKQNGKHYTFEHTAENFAFSREREREKNGDVWDCQLISLMKAHGSTICNPIIDFTTEDVWQYIDLRRISVNPLYKMGYKRIGCVGCPMGTQTMREKQFEDFPAYKRNYVKAFDRMLEKGRAEGKSFKWKDGTDVFNWWLEYEPKDEQQINGQTSLFE